MIDHVFTLINSAIILGLIVYLFRKYGLPALEKESAQEILDTQNLKRSLNDAQERIHDLEVIRIRQEAELAALQANILEWRKRVEEQASKIENEFLGYKATIKAKQLKQAQQYKNEQIIQELKPLVLEQLEKQAKNFMRDTDHQQEYTQKALQAFERVKV